MEVESFGIMSEAYRVSRREILDWINTNLKLELHKIEQLGTGAVLCQLLSAYFPGTVKIKHVNWNARSEHEFVANFKILQKGFAKKGYKKNIEVKKLVQCKYQDNLELIQWLKYILQSNGEVSPDYDPVSERDGHDLLYLSKDPKTVQKKNLKKKKTDSSNHKDIFVKEKAPKKKKKNSIVQKMNDEEKEQFEQAKKDIQFVNHLLSFSSDNAEIVDNLRKYFKVEAPEPEEGEGEN